MRLEHAVLIAATPERVWAVTVDVAGWPRWTPTVRSARPLGEAPFGPGSRYSLKQPLQPETVWEVTACRPGESFTWEARGTASTLRATHRLEPVDGGTRNVLVLEAEAMPWLLRRLSAFALKRENLGLKRFCERSGA